MLSVTIAAQSKCKRLLGGNFRAIGSSRLPVCELEQQPSFENRRAKNINLESMFMPLAKVFKKLFEIFISVFSFPCFYSRHTPSNIYYSSKDNCYENQKELNDRILITIFKNLSRDDRLKCKTVCRKWNDIVCNSKLIQLCADQIRLLFDEGEIIIHPIDEKKNPVRHQLKSLQMLSKMLSFYTTQSLFVRGLIPIECVPVLKILLNTQLQPHQLFFFRCKFSQESYHLLNNYVKMNSTWISDFGVEEVLPSSFFSDQFMDSFSENLTSLRLWNSECELGYGLTDLTLSRICKSIANGSPIETVELDNCTLSSNAVASVIKVWKDFAKSDMTIVLRNCSSVSKLEVIGLLSEHGIRYGNRDKIISKNWNLTFFCS